MCCGPHVAAFNPKSVHSDTLSVCPASIERIRARKKTGAQKIECFRAHADHPISIKVVLARCCTVLTCGNSETDRKSTLQSGDRGRDVKDGFGGQTG